MNCRRTWWGGIGGLGRRSLVVISTHSCGQAIVSQVPRKYTAIVSDEEEELIVSADYSLPLIARASLTGIRASH